MSTIDTSTPTLLAELADYQDGAVVSHTIAKSKAGTATVFAFDAGEGLSEHTAPFDALVLILDGQAAVKIGEVTHAMGAGMIVRLPANVPHALHATARFKMLLMMFRASSD